MAKRKRLEVPVLEPNSPLTETKQAFPPKTRMPIAEVAGDTAGRAALEEVAREMTLAEEEGRVVKRLPLSKIVMHHLSRDRIVIDEDEMAMLRASIAERGQQNPIEVVNLGADYGLISGMRRVLALREMGETHVLALVRRPETAEAAYRAMIEENEIRANLSFYERANIAVAAAGQGVYRTPGDAVTGLFAHAAPAKRSKIRKFVVIRDRLGKALTFPTAIPEKLGLRLAAAIEADAGVATRLSDALRKTPPADAAAERRTIERALKAPSGGQAAAPEAEIAPGVRLQAAKGRAVITGPGVDKAFLDALRDWAVSHAKSGGAKA